MKILEIKTDTDSKLMKEKIILNKSTHPPVR